MFSYITLSVVLYVTVRLWRYMVFKEEHRSTRIFAAICFVVMLFMIWNVIAANRFDLEGWHSYDDIRALGIQGGERLK